MLAYGEGETLPSEIRRDDTSGFPLISESDGILQLILAYLELPYSVTEHGCGKKASLIINYLLKLGLPAYGLARGMALERDMSPQAMVETDYQKRTHALVADNPLHHLCDLNDPRLRQMLLNTCSNVDSNEGVIQTGPYILRHDPRVQFAQARSHIYPILWFWDPDARKAVRRVIDPSLDRSRLFEPEHVRALLHAEEAMLFQAPLLGYFRLDVFSLTSRQRQELEKKFTSGEFSSDLEELNDRIEDLDQEEHARLIRSLNGAQEGSLGDPATWTYANNLQGWDRAQDQEQMRNTGRGEALRFQRRALIRAREGKQGDAPARRADLRQTVDDNEILKVCNEDADWSARALAPLADVTMTAVYFNSLLEISRDLDSSRLLQHITKSNLLHSIRGLGVRLRRRIDWLAEASLNTEGEIDARALSDPYFHAALETIRQMNAAGLHVCIDRAGNLHGLYLRDEEAYELQSGGSPDKYLKHSIHHISHIDSVKNAGRFDGRLGVAGGIEVAHILKDLNDTMEKNLLPHSREHLVRTHVSALLGEEMTFTGEGVSMPGSSAVAGLSQPEQIYRMQNNEGQVFLDRFLDFLEWMQQKQESGEANLLNEFRGLKRSELPDACFVPHHFFSKHTFERHIEQGPHLDRAGVPMAMVSRIMGIRQEDFLFQGEASEAAALEFNLRMRQLSLEPEFKNTRITVGILEGMSDFACHEDAQLAMRWTLEGEINHAGATGVEDRRDPGIAAARLTEFLRERIRERNESESSKLQGLAGNVRLYPGSNRNVIPGSVSLTLAVQGDSLDEEEARSLAQELQGFAVGTLAKKVASGGEGVKLSRMDRMSYINVYGSARLSVDLRSDREESSDSFRQKMDELLEEICHRFDVKVESEQKQDLLPYSLEESGQVLLMERSYGGSHNPNEAELQTDLSRGTMLQFVVIKELLQQKDLADLNLHTFTKAKIPEEYRKVVPEMISGALHDTCNMAAAAGRKD
ncbi:MAG: hypothetical protein KDK25_08115 [Leptospiraceae bacterium]|nr:hypothetical protein [Leptospiraceae bacterium]